MLTRLNGIYPAVVIGSFYLFDMECKFPQGKNKELKKHDGTFVNRERGMGFRPDGFVSNLKVVILI